MKDNAWVVVIAAGLSGAAAGDIINVGAGESIQDAIDVAMNGDEIVVALGTYVETINFLGKAITVRSSDPMDPTVVTQTIIDGGGSGTVVTCSSGEGSDTVLSGFVVTGGSATNGGGMFISFSSPVVRNCTFSGNSVSNLGGAMMNNAGSPTVINCAFTGNTAVNGGGMFNQNSSPMIVNCSFAGNTANNGGGAMSNFNGGTPTVTGCTFGFNDGTVGGGAMENVNGSVPTVADSGFCGNTPDAISGGYTDGGGNSLLYCAPPPPVSGCPEDIDGDNVVGITDFLMVLLSWGACR